MAEPGFSTGKRIRPGVFVAVLLLHVVAILFLIRAFAPTFTAQVTERVLATFTVTVTAPSPAPGSTPTAEPQRRAEAAQAAPARKAAPKTVVAPSSKIALAPKAAPSVAAQRNAARAGASAAGPGSGAAGQGSGFGSGGQSSGGGEQGGGGGGAAHRAVKIIGDIQSARDYPRETRDLRLGDYVEIVLSIDREGRVSNCRIQRSSRDPQADRITCHLAQQRFRFQPATDSAGNPTASLFGWRQRWYN